MHPRLSAASEIMNFFGQRLQSLSQAFTWYQYPYVISYQYPLSSWVCGGSYQTSHGRSVTRRSRFWSRVLANVCRHAADRDIRLIVFHAVDHFWTKVRMALMLALLLAMDDKLQFTCFKGH